MESSPASEKTYVFTYGPTHLERMAEVTGVPAETLLKDALSATLMNKYLCYAGKHSLLEDSSAAVFRHGGWDAFLHGYLVLLSQE
mmetsp:Transcript_24631/g.24232  ORF Transcript_24631/g.24232 Transcript_24631/m.24232 type:complete len:85 (+) Transcript_24631:1-255(+)